MTGLGLSIRSAVFYWRTHLSVLAGTMLAAAVLVGAMLVGDSVRYSLVQSALLRLGDVHYAMNVQGRFFREDLADRVESESEIKTTPVLLLRGIATKQQGEGSKKRQVNDVQVVGVDKRFWGFSGNFAEALTEDGIAVNVKLATELGLKQGDEISIRIGKPTLLPRDAPLSSRKSDDTVRGTFPVVSIIPDNRLGRFSLTASQIVPYNVFVDLKWLQKRLSLEARANLLLAADGGDATERKLSDAVTKSWRIEDAGLVCREVENRGLFQIESDRIFMDPVISRAVQGIEGSVGVLTYLVNSISREGTNGQARTPYSFVTAISPSTNRLLGVVPADMKDDEIILNRWLADNLPAKTGETVRLSYYELLPSNRFVEKSRVFKVSGILEMADVSMEKELAPKFPGLTDVDRCSDWDIGIPLDKAKMEDKANEAYWKTYRDTPKAFVTLKAGQEMWSNRFGGLTDVRYSEARCGKELVVETFLKRVNPSELGLGFLPVRQTALKAANDAMDFGQLFLGMSFFLIVAGLMLTAMLFSFGIQQRSKELGILLAVGYRPGQVRRLMIQESCLIALAGAIAGALLGTFYTRALIWGLSNFWQGAVANSAIQYHAGPLTIVEGIVVSFLCALFSLVLAMRKQFRKSAWELLSGDSLQSMACPAGPNVRRARSLRGVISAAGVAVALGIIAYAVITGSQDTVPVFFAAGALLLIALLGLGRELLIHLNVSGGHLSLDGLGFRNAGRRIGRSMTVAALLACGCFLVFAVSSMQEDVGARAERRSSGTGGFAFFGESTIPVQADLNTVEGRRKFRLDGESALQGVSFISLKVRDGDDASCLNLNRAQSPKLLAVNPDVLAEMKAFILPGSENVWDLLKEKLPDGVVPGLAGDSNTAMWGLERKAGRDNGDILMYRDEQGGMFRVKLVGSLPMRLSVFQGTILIPAGSFEEKYPSESGYRMFLVDVPGGTGTEVKEILNDRLDRLGFSLVPAVQRLREFYAVESTYMLMFLVLGGMGLLLGSAGMGIVVLRNIMERRGELGLLRAVGYSDGQVRRMILAEHWLILGVGLVVGIVASLVAMWPSFSAPGVALPYLTIVLFFAGIAGFQVLWIVISVWMAMRQSMLGSLRSE